MDEWRDWTGMFITVPTIVVMDEELSGDEKILFGVILGLSRADGYCRATNAYLAKLMKISDRSVQRNISSLKKSGFIDVEIVRDERGEVQERQIRCMISFKGDKIELTGNAPKIKKAKEEQKHAYGSMKNVLLTDKQYSDLKALYPTIDEEIENMSLYCAANGKPYKNCYAALQNWMRRRAKEEKPKGSRWDGVDY